MVFIFQDLVNANIIFQDLVNANMCGRKSGKGMFVYAKDTKVINIFNWDKCKNHLSVLLHLKSDMRFDYLNPTMTQLKVVNLVSE